MESEFVFPMYPLSYDDVRWWHLQSRSNVDSSKEYVDNVTFPNISSYSKYSEWRNKHRNIHPSRHCSYVKFENSRKCERKLSFRISCLRFKTQKKLIMNTMRLELDEKNCGHKKGSLRQSKKLNHSKRYGNSELIIIRCKTKRRNRTQIHHARIRRKSITSLVGWIPSTIQTISIAPCQRITNSNSHDEKNPLFNYRPYPTWSSKALGWKDHEQ